MSFSGLVRRIVRSDHEPSWHASQRQSSTDVLLNDRHLCNHIEMVSTSELLPVHDLAGQPSFARGVSLGAQSSERVSRSLLCYSELLPVLTGRTWKQLQGLARPMIEAGSRLDRAIVDELHGVATGANVSIEDISVLAARSELLQMGTTPIGECTTVARDGYIGQTWDWFTSQLDSCILVRTQRFAAFAEAGMPPKIGVNANGVAVTLNFLATTLPVDPHGLPVHLLLHHVLERATSTEDAIQRLLSVRSAACAAIGLLDSTGQAAVVELAPQGRSALAHVQTPFVQTNHCLSAELRGLDVAGILIDNSFARLNRASALAVEGTPIEDILCDNDGSWHPIALAPDADAPKQSQLGTVVAILIDVAQRSLKVAPGNPSNVGFAQRLSVEDHSQ
jgi:isopenicillin-N N-acyltransferase like protein